jgi:RNA polymerase sigma-70 factor (ECF subfamily)
MSPDNELILKAQQGDMAAFTELVRRHDRDVLAVAARYVDNSEDAKDIYQEVLIRVFRGIRGFEFRSEFSTWIHRITVNTCLTHHRRARKVAVVPLEGGTKEEGGNIHAAELPSTALGPEESTISSDAGRQLRRALQSLSPRQRMVFTLRHYQGHSLREIAQALHCSEGTVKRYLFTATRRMRDELADFI